MRIVLYIISSGGSGYSFLKLLTDDELIEDVKLLYDKLVDLGVEIRNGEVYLAELIDV